MVTKTHILQTHRLGNTLVVSPLTDLAELDYARIEAEASDVLRLFELTQLRNVVLDLQHADYSGSLAITFFLKLWKEVKRRGGKMALCHVSPHEREILRLCNLDRLWPVFKSRNAALAAVTDQSRLLHQAS